MIHRSPYVTESVRQKAAEKTTNLSCGFLRTALAVNRLLALAPDHSYSYSVVQIIQINRLSCTEIYAVFVCGNRQDSK